MACSAGCPTQNHRSYGECLRAKSQAVVGCKSARGNLGDDKTVERRWNKELTDYKAARDAGIQPDSTEQKKIDFAVRMSDKFGMAYGEQFRVIPDAKRRAQAVTNQQIREAEAAVGGDDYKLIKEAAKAVSPLQPGVM